MADRGASGAFITEIMKSANQPIYLVEVYFDSGTIYLSNAYRPVAYSGNTYGATAYLMSFAGLVESSDLQIPNVTVGLSGVDLSWVSIMLSEPYTDRRLVIRKAFLDNVEAVVSSPVIIFDGRIDSMMVTDDPDQGGCGISVTASSQWVDFLRTPGRHTNFAEEQVWFSGDKGFEFADALNLADLKWGTK